MSEDVLIREFAGLNAPYYARTFGVIQSSARQTWTLNVGAMMFGALWAGARGLGFLFYLLVFLDIAALAPVVLALHGRGNPDLNARVQQLEETVAKRRAEAETALAEGNASKSATSTKLADNLQKVADAARAEVIVNAAGTTERLVLGLVVFGLARLGLRNV